MDVKRLFKFLEKKNKVALIELLRTAYDTMDTEQRQDVFGPFVEKAPSLRVDGKKLIEKVRKFHNDSLKGKYYASFDMNSKNFMYVPEETKVWFETLGDFLEASVRLTIQGDHRAAAQCFRILYELIEAMEDGDPDIVFADELGSWMIPGEEKKFIHAYLKSLATAVTSEEFTNSALQLICRDRHQSFSTQAYASAMRIANKEQKDYLETEIRRQNIETGPIGITG